MTEGSQCFECKRYNEAKAAKKQVFTCEAYPNGIPDKLLFNRVKHTKPFKGDGGLQFVAKK